MAISGLGAMMAWPVLMEYGSYHLGRRRNCMALRYGLCWETVRAASGSERVAADWCVLRPAGSQRLTSRKDCPAIRSPRSQKTKADDYGWEPKLAWRCIRTETWPS